MCWCHCSTKWASRDTPITTAGEGRLGLARELIERDFKLWHTARRFRPDVMVGFGGVAISHVGKLTGIPSLSFYDTEHAELQIRLAIPFISEWHVPDTWQGRIAPGAPFTSAAESSSPTCSRTISCLRPTSPGAAGWDPDRDNFLVRTVSWRANHDRGRSGIPIEQLRTIVDFLGGRGKLHVSAEGELPADSNRFGIAAHRCSSIISWRSAGSTAARALPSPVRR